MTLVHLPDDIKQEFSVNEKGEVSTTIRGCARLINIDESGLRKNFASGCGENPSKMSALLIGKGFQVRTFSENGIPDTAFVFICEYYAFDAGKRCTDEAKNLYRAFAAIGFRTWVQKELDWESKQQSPKTSPLSILKQTAETLNMMADEVIKLDEKYSELQEQVDYNETTTKIQGRNINGVQRDMLDYEKRTQFLEASVEDAFKASKDARFYLKQIDESTSEDIEVAELTTRAKIRKIALSFAAAQNVHPRDVWSFLYRQFRDRYHYDAKRRSKNSGLNPLGQVEADGVIEDFYNMTVHCLVRYPSFGWWDENGETIRRDRSNFDI